MPAYSALKMLWRRCPHLAECQVRRMILPGTGRKPIFPVWNFLFLIYDFDTRYVPF